MRIDNSRCRTENYFGQFSVDTASVLLRVQTLKLNTLAINLAFMRLSRGIEGSDGCDAKSVGTLGRERERWREERGWKLCTRTYILVPGRGMSCSHGDTLTHRTDHWRRKKMVRSRVGRKILRRIPCSLIYYSARRAWATVIRAMTLAMSCNLEETTSQLEGLLSLPLFSSALAFITGQEDMSPRCTKICDAFYILPCAYTFINPLRKLWLAYTLLTYFCYY